jgi:hypothetical protein
MSCCRARLALRRPWPTADGASSPLGLRVAALRLLPPGAALFRGIVPHWPERQKAFRHSSETPRDSHLQPNLLLVPHRIRVLKAQSFPRELAHDKPYPRRFVWGPNGVRRCKYPTLLWCVRQNHTQQYCRSRSNPLRKRVGQILASGEHYRTSRVPWFLSRAGFSK